MSNLILFSTLSGAEIIAEKSETSYDPINNSLCISVTHPLVVRPIQQDAGRYALDLYPYSLTNPDGVHKFNMSSILSVSQEIPQMLEKAYLERTSSILIASAVDAFEKL